MRTGRRLLLALALTVAVATPAAALIADPFGAIEVADPTGRPGELIYDGPSLAVDGAGNAAWIGYARTSGDDQMAVFERCGATWQRKLVGTPQENWLGEGIRVTPDGTAMVVWRGDDAGGTLTHYSSVRPPGGAWGAPQVIVSDDTINSVQFALADNGTAVAVWADDSPAGTYATFRQAGGTWGQAEQVVATSRNHDVALSATGDAVLLYRGSYPGYAFSKYRPAGGPWGAAVEVIVHNYPDTMQGLMVEFDGLGRTVALAEFREFVDTVRVNVGTGGGWGPKDQVLDYEVTHDLRNLVGLARHPQGAVAVWTRRSTSSNFNDDVVVSRLSGTWDTPKVFDAPNRYTTPSVATNATGEILVAAGLNHGAPTGGVDDIHAAVAPSLTGAWGAMTRISPEGTSANLYRDAARGRRRLGVLRRLGRARDRELADGDRLDEAARGVRAIRRRRPRRRPTATVTPDPAPNPLPVPSPTPERHAGPARVAAAEPERDRRLHDPAGGVQVRQRPQADAPLQAPAQGLHGQDRHREGQREEGGDAQGRQAQAAVVSAQAAPRHVHRHRLDHAQEGQGADRAAALHGL